MPEDRARSERPLPERLPLGEASRLLGVDPDTLRRWADEGRVPAFTTPGGHRRFERRALERLVAARRTGPAGGLAGLGETGVRLGAAYRRRYGYGHGGDLDPRTRVPAAERELFRENGRRLVDAMVRHLDEVGPGRARAEHEATRLAAELGDRLARNGVTLDEGVSMFIVARRPFLAELSVLARRSGVDPIRLGQLYDTSTGFLDRLLLAFVEGHTAAGEDDADGAGDGHAGLAPHAAGNGDGQGRAGGDGHAGGDPLDLVASPAPAAPSTAPRARRPPPARPPQETGRS